MATSGGAKALHLNAGRIAPAARECGRAADLVLSLVYSENGRSVDTVLVGGEVLLEDGRSLRIDESELARRAGQLAAKVDSARSRWTERKRDPEVMERARAAEKSYREAASST